MVCRLMIEIGAFAALITLSACSGTPEVMRVQSNSPVAVSPLSNVSQKFMAETPHTVNFDFNKDELDLTARSVLDMQARWILAHPHVRFSVFGHTDKVGSLAYNHDLGKRRAVRAMNYLIEKGINPKRLQALVTHGEKLPIVETETRERMNRRATTQVQGFFAPQDSDDDRPSRNAPAESVQVVVVDNDSRPVPGPVVKPDQKPKPGPSSKPKTGGGKNKKSGGGKGDPGKPAKQKKAGDK